ncbi:MAG TPA: glycoside hydrolase family 127 protein, partial [Armatimonadota bacterium]|nr:glycoside hydrolase family 127 protein [Armatimonadota bacterium]
TDTEEFTFFLRIPGWARGAQVLINGRPARDVAPVPGQYVRVHRLWEDGDIIRLILPLPVERVQSHPYVASNNGRVALRRGPLIYCVEQVDLDGLDPRDLVLPSGSEIAARWEPELLGGVVTLGGPALARREGQAWGPALYDTAGSVPPPEEAAARLRAVPYYAWANREPGGMAVWIRSE